jgi:hypothetical protein
MIKLNKDTLEFEFIDTLTCHCGGGSDDSGGGNDSQPTGEFLGNAEDGSARFSGNQEAYDRDNNRNNQAEAQRQAGEQRARVEEAARQQAAAEAAQAQLADARENSFRQQAQMAVANQQAQAQSNNNDAPILERFAADRAAMSPNTVLPNVAQSQFLNLPASQGGQIDLRTGLPVNSQTSQTAPVVMGGGTNDMGSSNPITDLTVAGRPDVYKDKVIRDAGNDAMAQADGFANAEERDFYFGLAQNARQGNDYLEEVRRLDDRGFLGNQIAAGIGAGGVPVLNQNGEIMGVNTTRDFMGIPVTTYTGRPEFAPNADDANRNDNDDPIVALQQNPLTGTEQCPDGYEFDEDLQACKMKSERKTGTRDTSGVRYYRATSLDNAPANVPAGFDFAAANRNFVDSFAYNPLNYRKPMGLDGFSKVSGLL